MLTVVAHRLMGVVERQRCQREIAGPGSRPAERMCLLSGLVAAVRRGTSRRISGPQAPDDDNRDPAPVSTKATLDITCKETTTSPLVPVVVCYSGEPVENLPQCRDIGHGPGIHRLEPTHGHDLRLGGLRIFMAARITRAPRITGADRITREARIAGAARIIRAAKPSLPILGRVRVIAGSGHGIVDAPQVCALTRARRLRRQPPELHQRAIGDPLPRTPLDPALPMPPHQPMRQLHIRHPTHHRWREHIIDPHHAPLRQPHPPEQPHEWYMRLVDAACRQPDVPLAHLGQVRWGSRWSVGRR